MNENKMIGTYEQYEIQGMKLVKTLKRITL